MELLKKILKIFYCQQKKNSESKIKYLEYEEANGYIRTGINYIINIEEEIVVKKYNFSQETFEHEETDK